MATDPVTAAYAVSLRRLRAEQNLSRIELARRAGVSPESITNVENGTGGTTIATAGRLAAALGTDLPSMITIAAEGVRRG